MKCFIGIDVGTSLIKASLYNIDGKTLKESSYKVPVIYPKEGYAEQDMIQVWNGVVECIKEITSNCGENLKDITALACAGQGDGLWALDKNGEPVRNAILWSDNRASDIVEEWIEQGIVEKFFKKSGNVLWPGSTAAILRWLKKEELELYDKIENYFFCKDWINYKLTGVIATDTSDGTIPFMDLKKGVTSKEQIQLLGLDDNVFDKSPKLLKSFEIIGTIKEEIAQLTGLPKGLPIATGCIDVSANAIAAGAVNAGQTFSIIGTTLLNAILVDKPVSEPENIGFMLSSPIPNQWLRVLGSLSGTPNLDWFLREVYKDEQSKDLGLLYSQIQKDVEGTPVGANKVLFLPFLHGERSPFVNANATSAFLGIREKTTKADMARAVFEGVALAAKHNLESVNANFDEMIVTGGGSNNPAWCQIFADVTGAKISVSGKKELGTLGAAIIAAKGVHAIDNFRLGDIDKEAECNYLPNKENSKYYSKLYKVYLSAIEQMEIYWKKRQELP